MIPLNAQVLLDAVSVESRAVAEHKPSLPVESTKVPSNRVVALSVRRVVPFGATVPMPGVIAPLTAYEEVQVTRTDSPAANCVGDTLSEHEGAGSVFVGGVVGEVPHELWIAARVNRPTNPYPVSHSLPEQMPSFSHWNRCTVARVSGPKKPVTISPWFNP